MLFFVRLSENLCVLSGYFYHKGTQRAFSQRAQSHSAFDYKTQRISMLIAEVFSIINSPLPTFK